MKEENKAAQAAQSEKVVVADLCGYNVYQNWDDAYRVEFNYNNRSKREVLDHCFLAEEGAVWYAYEPHSIQITTELMEDYGIDYDDDEMTDEKAYEIVDKLLKEHFGVEELKEEFNDADYGGVMTDCEKDYQPEYYVVEHGYDGICFIKDIKVKCTMMHDYVNCEVIE